MPVKRALSRHVLASIRKHRLLAPGQHVLVAVSGGPDSVALLHVLRELAPALRLRLTAAHLDHRIRGRAAREDAAFVRRLCRGWHVPLVEGRSDVPRRARRKGISLEMAAREARYAFLGRALRRVRAPVVATGHTADDAAETVVLNLARGAGRAGLGGIPRAAAAHGARVVRPLLDVTRAEVVAWLERHGVAWREDVSNRDPAYLRNRVRHEVLPFLERTLNPNLRRTLTRTAELLRSEDDWLEAVAGSLLRECRAARGDLDAGRFAAHPPALQRRVLRQWLAQQGVPSGAVDFAAVDRVVALAAGRGAGGRTPLAGGWEVCRARGRLGLRRARAARAPAAFRAAVCVPGETLLREQGLDITTGVEPGLVKDRSGAPGRLPARASLRRSAVGRRRLYVRSWRAGDRMKPLGLRGSKKLQDVFTDAKVPPARRRAVPLFECAGEIVWVPGYRVARGWEVVDPRRACLQIRVARL